MKPSDWYFLKPSGAAQLLAKVASWILLRLFYRVRTKGMEFIPDKGAAVLVANHVSYLDAVLIAAHVKRPITFAMWVGIYNMAPWFFRALGAVPIAGKTENPAIYRLAMQKIDRALARGELVCIFPEGKITRDGVMNAFKPGVLKILARRPVPVVPMGIRGLWGSYFSFRYGAGFAKVPRHWFAKVTLEASPAIPPMSELVEMERTVKRLVFA